MMYESSKDYISGSITILFDGETPTESEILDFVKDNYAFTGTPQIEIEPENEFRGLTNPAVIKVYCCFF